MKKIISLIGIVAIMLAMTFTAFAGSIDVDLVYEDEALVFIGTIDDYEITHEEEDYPSTEYTLTLTPNQKIKGDVVVDTPMSFEKVRTGSLKLKIDTNYLFGYVKEELYIWELESYNDLLDWEIDDYTAKSIILKDRHNNSISEGMQNFLNEGVFARAEIERQDIGNQISFAEFLYAKPMSGSNVKKVTLRYQDEVHEVDVEEFEKVAKEIMITNVKNKTLHDINAKPKQPEPYKTNLYIELLDENDQCVNYAAVSRHGEVDRYALMMSRLMEKDYEMKTDDLQKLYSLFPKDVQKNIVAPEGIPSSEEPMKLQDMEERNYTPWLYGGGIAVFVIAFIIGVMIKKRRG